MRARRRSTWLIGANDLLTPVAKNVPVNVDITSSTQIRDDLDGDGTLVRTVGDIYWTWGLTEGVTSPADFVIDCGIIVTQVDDTGSAPASLLPSNSFGQEFKWLWQRRWYARFSLLTTAGQSILFPTTAVATGPHQAYGFTNHPMIDLKVKRRLRTGNQLSMYFQVNDVNNVMVGGSLAFTCNIRTLYLTARR